VSGTVHIVGAGLAGLSCAVRLAAAGVKVVLYEAAGHAGGRCRSFRDRNIDRVIDNGNHLVLSGNRSTRAYLAEIGAGDQVFVGPEAAFPFLDLADGARWTVRPNSGRVPWWLFSGGRRTPGGSAMAHLRGLTGLWRAGKEATVADILGENPLFHRFWEPLAVAILNTPADTGSAGLLWSAFVESFVSGGDACRPVFTRHGLGAAFVDPALARLAQFGVTAHFNNRLTGIRRANGRITELELASGAVGLDDDDRIVLALPAAAINAILPEVAAPAAHHAIVNAHYRLGDPVGQTRFLGLIGGAAQWVFLRGDVASVTVSAADELARQNAGTIADRLWQDVARALGLAPEPVPPNRVIKERRATVAQTPAFAASRPGASTIFANLLLAGDWTATGLPATIEGAIRSGHNAAAVLLDR
jgi:squalene-associated FAD-dependent desaturase